MNLGFPIFFRFAAFFSARRVPPARGLSKSRSLNSSVNRGFRGFAAFAARVRFGTAFFFAARRDFDAVLLVGRFLVEGFLAITILLFYGRTTMVLPNACLVSS
ncbi:hypothetical protein IVB33_39055 [Bradyrhizobium sp. 24]|nr:hypothetical protein [Bradyrhizobium sp. 24]